MRMPVVRGRALAREEQLKQDPGMSLLPSFERELRSKGQIRITVRKGVKWRGYRQKKWCVSGLSQILLSTPSSCTGQTQLEKLSGNFEHKISIPMFTICNPPEMHKMT